MIGGGSRLDISTASMIMSQSMVNIAVLKMAMNNGEENANQITDMMKNMSLEPNMGQHINVSA